MNKLHAGKDGLLLDYIECFYQSTNDHERALAGALIVGALEMILASKLEQDSKEHE